MTPASLIGPIAAATIVNVFLFALTWRGIRSERQDGNLPWPHLIGIVSYIGVVGGFFYLNFHKLVVSSADVFVSALFAEAFAAAIVYALIFSFWTGRALPMRQRAFPMIVAGLLTCLIFADLIANA